MAHRSHSGGGAPTVSVVMVCRDGAALLPEALASLRAQTFEDWELLFFDNGSQDGSADLARAFDERVRVVGVQTALALGAARADALAETRGRFIAFLDHDDAWVEEKLERQVAALTETGAALTYADCWVVDEGGRRLGRYARRVRPREGSYAYAPLLRENYVPTVTAMITRVAYEAAGPFDPAREIPADYDLWLRIARTGRLAFDARPLASYRVRRGSLTSDVDAAYQQVEALLIAVRDRAADERERRWVDDGRAAHLWRWAWRGLLRGSGLRAWLGRFVSGCRAAGNPWAACMGAVRVHAALVRGLGVRIAMIRSRRD